jgi:hypothetical protein
MCADSGVACRELAQAREKGLSEDRCREGRATLQEIMKVPVQISEPRIREAFAKAIGAEKMYEAGMNAGPLISTLRSDLRSGLRSPVAVMDRLRAIGPPACTELIVWFQRRDLDPQMKRILHQLLVELRGGDLGADAAPWWPWCHDVFKQNLSP